MYKNTIAFIESNTTGSGHVFIKRALAQGYHVIFLTKSPFKYAFLQQDIVHTIVVDTCDEDALHAYLAKIHSLRAVFSTSEYYIEIASRLAKRFGLPANDPNAISLCRDKGRLAAKLQELNIQVPHTFTAYTPSDLKNILSQLSLPVVIKPAAGSGSIGVKLCYDKYECTEHATYLLNEASHNSILVQQYIQGDEFSVETISLGGKAQVVGITRKYISSEPYFVEIGHDYPAVIAADLEQAIKHYAVTILNKIQFASGPAHLELKVKGSELYLIEINPRLAGGMIPDLIKHASGIDLIDLTLSIITGNAGTINRPHQGFASIRFIVAETSGKISSIKLNCESMPDLIAVAINRKAGDYINKQNDFTDRLGYFIVRSADYSRCIKLAEMMRGRISVAMQTVDQKKNNTQSLADTGRLKSVLSLDLQAIINKKHQAINPKEEFSLLSEIDEAHLLMLHKQRLISKLDLVLLLKKISVLRADEFSTLLDKPIPRGRYLLYEQELIESLGAKVAGNINLGRSRNDINATVFRLKLKSIYFTLYKKELELSSVILNLAALNKKTVLPIYSQYQTALPGTFAHYLLAVASALDRDLNDLQSLYENINTSPLGAGAGGGTTINIDPKHTAKNLGFEHVAYNSLDAVASRDLALRVLSNLNITSITLSRLTEDLQLWSTREFDLIRFSDDVCGGSSMMPQKKNPYLLEKIKGRLAGVLAEVVKCTLAMQKVPFGNSVEVGTEAIQNIFPTINIFIDTVSLIIILLKNLSIDDQKVTETINDNFASATYFTELLSKTKGYDFRTAHHLMGQAVRNSIINNSDIIDGIKNLFPGNSSLHIPPLDIALQMNHGFGPGCKSIEYQYHQLSAKIGSYSTWLYSILDATNQLNSEKLLSIQYHLNDLSTSHRKQNN